MILKTVPEPHSKGLALSKQPFLVQNLMVLVLF